MKPAPERTAVLIVALVVAAMSAGSARGQDDSDAALALDQKLEKLTIAGKELPDALTEIGNQAGVAITIDERAANLLPWGRRTRLAAVTISNASLREALPRLLGPLGMTYGIRDGGIVVVATEPLKRICRRATWEELKLLQRCHELEYTPEHFATFNIQYKITRKVDAVALLGRQLERAGRGTLAEMLEAATGSLGWVWLPDGDHIKIRTAEAQVANQLARRVTIRYENAPLSRILMDLADRAAVALHLEPGLMLKVAPAAARSSLVLQHTSVRQALNLISAETGLEYHMRRDGLHVGLAEGLDTGDAPAKARRSPYVGKISVSSDDGSYSYDFLLREDELPADILEYRKQIIQEYIDRMRQDMAPEGVAPGNDPGGP